MAEIYKQQLEHKVTDGEKLRAAPFKNYFAQGLNDAEEGFRQLDEYLQYLGDKELASKMDMVIRDTAEEINNWQDFNTEGRNKLLSNIMENYDRTLASAPLDAQRRLNDNNPEARNIYALKAREKILDKAKKQVYAEKERDFDAMADIVAYTRGTKANEDALRAMLARVNENPGDLLDVQSLGELTDKAGNKAVLQTIGQAIIEGRSGDAQWYLSNPFYSRFMTPSQKLNFQHQLQSLIKSQSETGGAAGAASANNGAQMLIAMRDGLFRRYPMAGEYIDQDMNAVTKALYEGQSLRDVTILQWADDMGVPVSELLGAEGARAVEYWDSLPMTQKQQAINKYWEIVGKVTTEGYDVQQDRTARAFNNFISQSKFMDVDDKTKEVTVDLSNASADERRQLKQMVNDLNPFLVNSSDLTRKNAAIVRAALRDWDDSAAKAVSLQNSPIEQRMAGDFSKSFRGFGNLTEATIRSAEKGEDRPSIIQGMVSNMTRPGLTIDATWSELGEGAANKALDIASGKGQKVLTEALQRTGMYLGMGPLSGTPSDFNYFDDGGKANAEAFANMAGEFMRVSGEIDEDGDLKAPKANTYRFMTYIVPLMLGAVSVWGNEDDIKDTGVKRDFINMSTVVAIKDVLQDVYADRLDKEMKTYRTEGVKYQNKPESGIPAPAAPAITDTDPYQMLEVALDIAKKMGLANKDVQPNEEKLIDLGVVLNGLAKDEFPEVNTLAEDSSARERIDYNTKPVYTYSQKGIKE